MNNHQNDTAVNNDVLNMHIEKHHEHGENKTCCGDCKNGKAGTCSSINEMTNKIINITNLKTNSDEKIR